MAKAKTKKTKTAKKQVVVDKTQAVEIPQAELPETDNKISVDLAEFEQLKKYKAIVDEAEAKNAAVGKVVDNNYEYFDPSFDKGSSVPAWALPRQVEVLEDEVSRTGSMLKKKQIPIEEIPYAEADYKRKSERLEQIKNSKPKLTGLQRDKLREKRDKLAEEISRSKFTRMEMEKMLVDPHEEADRMSNPCIDIDREEAKRMGIPVSANGKVSRSVAEGAWKMMSTLLEDTPANPNTETLRSDTGKSKRNMVTLPEGFDYNKLPKKTEPEPVT
tara:strand:+ start:18147 stop:18965 length:819 start_codon:yes stop_codon:yes gene_type:complete